MEQPGFTPSSLLVQWPVDVTDVKAVGDVYSVAGVGRRYVLKPINKGMRRARFICSLTEYLGRGADPLTPGLIRTRVGKLLTTESRRRHWILCEWIPGRTCDWADLGDAARCAAALARFHTQARDYCHLPHERPQAYWDRWPTRLLRRYEALRGFCAAAERAVQAGGAPYFDRMVAAQSARQLARAQDAMRVLAASPYRSLCAEYRRRGQVIHGDPAGRNFVATENGMVRIIDLESIRQDLPALDIAKLLRRVLKSHGWRTDVAMAVLSAYADAGGLDPSMLPVVYAFIAYPMKFSYDVRRYYTCAEGWAYRRHLRKLIKHLWGEKGKQRFLDWFGRDFARAPYAEADHAGGC
ncbi:MAG: phosphotransferase [Bacillota bacterium]|nr:phosphotransferase [Bacillota bacterium]